VNATQEAGSQNVQWDGTNDVGAKVSSGIYIYRLEANDFVQAKKMILMK
jgi:flagellar hook assembly protein FlgD